MGWSTSDDTDSGFKVTAGTQINESFALNLSYNDLGEAGLGNSNPAVTERSCVEYKVYAFMVDYAPWTFKDGVNFYGKFGVSSIKNEVTNQVSFDGSDITPAYDDKTVTQLALGLGLKWDLSDTFFMKTELERFDRDAYFISLQVGGYF